MFKVSKINKTWLAVQEMPFYFCCIPSDCYFHSQLLLPSPIAASKSFLNYLTAKRIRMKNTSMNLKSVLASLAIAVLLAVSANPVFANTEKRVSKNRVPVEVKYVGSNNQSPVVEISLDNEEGKEVTVQLRDLDGYILYTATTSEKKITRKFQIDNYSLEPIQLKVAVTINGKVQTEVFQINRNRTVVEDVVVSKL